MADPQGGQHATYSFLVHSSSSPDASLRFDNSSSQKQKRKRTSPHDHAILEAAYQRNSKPDKKERADIVSQVDLGEKEVQIWFQNRRQNDRRKSKPLQPHELIAHLRNGIHPESSPPSYNPTKPSQTYPAGQSPHAGAVSCSPAQPSSIHELLNPTSSSSSSTLAAEAVVDGPPSATGKTLQSGQTITPPSSFDACRPHISAQPLENIPSSASRLISSGHGRKRSHDVMVENLTSIRDAPDAPKTITLPPLRKSSSFVRLAMTVDGAVKVRTNNEPTPSPPKQRPPPPKTNEHRSNALARSQSDLSHTFDFKDANPPVRRAGGAGFGRSRDARTWEFYCDRDSGDALETQAEAERNGSAIGAINLIRSSSQRNKTRALSPNVAKQNVRRAPVDMLSKKPQLSRARSSMARLQSDDGLIDKTDVPPKRPRHERSSSGDSDKENWAPGTRLSQNPLRRMHPSVPRPSILQESDTSHRALSTHGHPLPVPNVEKENATRPASGNPGVIGTPSKAKGDDLDCIQGLLSLSQGAWR